MRASADLLERVRAGGLLAAGRPVVVLFSGGRDSTCLLDLAVRIVGPAALTALHVNYGLRDGAELDERHCAGVCERLDGSIVPIPHSPPSPPSVEGSAQIGPSAALAGTPGPSIVCNLFCKLG